jgi:hypothetical protein
LWLSFANRILLFDLKVFSSMNFVAQLMTAHLEALV